MILNTVKTLLATLGAVTLLGLSSHAATLLVGSNAPSSNVLTSQTNSSSFAIIRSQGTNNQDFLGTEGQTFLMPDTGDANTQYNVTGITIRKAAEGQTYSTGPTAASLTFWLYEWNPNTNGNDDSNWIGGDGLEDGDLFDGTTITNIFENASVISLAGQTINNGDYLTFDFGSGYTLDENKTYGFMVGYKGLDNDGTNSNRFTYATASTVNPYGGGLQHGTVPNGHSAGDPNTDLAFWVQGAAIPEPSSLALTLLGFGGIFMLIRRI